MEVGTGAGVVFVVDVFVSVVRARMGFREVRAQEGGYFFGVLGFGEGGAEVGAVLMALLGFPFFVFFFFFFGDSGSEDDVVVGAGFVIGWMGGG